jgi:hypothetical protein
VTYLNAKLVSVSGTSQASLTGQGIEPQFSLTPSSFPVTTVGASSSGVVTVTNDSLVPLTYASESFQGADESSWGFTGSACIGAIQSSQSCSLDVSFSPKGQGTLSVTFEVELQLTVRSHTSDLYHRAALTGSAVLPSVQIGAPALGSTPKGVSETAQAELTNDSNVSVAYDGYGFSGTNADDFSVISNTCGSAIAPSSDCELTVQFTPSASSPGSESATLHVTVDVLGTDPVVTTGASVAVSGTESS